MSSIQHVNHHALPHGSATLVPPSVADVAVAPLVSGSPADRQSRPSPCAVRCAVRYSNSGPVIAVIDRDQRITNDLALTLYSEGKRTGCVEIDALVAALRVARKYVPRFIVDDANPDLAQIDAALATA